MSWYSDNVSKWYENVTNGAKWLNEHNPVGHGMYSRDVSNFLENESKKANLRGAEITSFVSGLPGIGNIIKGLDGINQLEDLYSRTGKVPEYPGVQNAGSSALGKGVGGLSRKIEDGTHDLFQFYTGDKDDTIESLHEKGLMKYGGEI